MRGASWGWKARSVPNFWLQILNLIMNITAKGNDTNDNCKRFDNSCYHHQCIANRTAVILLQVLNGHAGEPAARSLQFYLQCTDGDNRSYLNVCNMSFVSLSLAVIFIRRLFSTSAFRVPNIESLSKNCRDRVKPIIYSTKLYTAGILPKFLRWSWNLSATLCWGASCYLVIQCHDALNITLLMQWGHKSWADVARSMHFSRLRRVVC